MGIGSKYVRSRRPFMLRGTSGFLTKSQALRLEYSIKQLPKHKKLAALLETL